MLIGELARRAEVSAKTIRYYEDLGLLPAPRRTQSGYRHYTEDDAARLDFIARAKRLGLSLGEIAGVLAVCRAGQAPCSHVIALLDRRIAEVDRAVKELQAFRAELARVREAAAAGIPAGTVCGIIEHESLTFHEAPLYLRRSGLARRGGAKAPRTTKQRAARSANQFPRGAFHFEGVDLDLDWKL